MTVKGVLKESKRYYGSLSEVIKPLLFASIFLIFIMNSSTVRADAYDAMLFLAKRLIPTLFPFAALTQIMLSENIKLPFSGVLGKLFGIPENLTLPLALGIVCGFPIGAILVREQYKEGLVERDQAERIIILSSHPSIAFLLMISRDCLPEKAGKALLPLSLLIVFVFLILSRPKNNKTGFPDVISRQSVSFVKCITASGEAMLNLSFFVIAFSALASVIKSTIKKPYATAFIIPFFEITSAINYLSSASISEFLKLFLIPFSVGFCGLCVLMQIKNILSDTDLEIKKYIPVKLFHGILLGAAIYLISR